MEVTLAVNDMLPDWVRLGVLGWLPDRVEVCVRVRVNEPLCDRVEACDWVEELVGVRVTLCVRLRLCVGDCNVDDGVMDGVIAQLILVACSLCAR